MERGSELKCLNLLWNTLLAQAMVMGFLPTSRLGLLAAGDMKEKSIGIFRFLTPGYSALYLNSQSPTDSIDPAPQTAHWYF